MTKRTPWMPFTGLDFYTSQAVALMDADAEAAYMRLLWEEWANGSLPEDPAQIVRLLPAKFHRRWKAIWPQLEAKFPVVDGRRSNPRANAERCRAAEMLDRKRRGAETTNAARWGSGERSHSDAQSDRSATLERHAKRSPQTETGTKTGEEIPPSPLAGGDTPPAAVAPSPPERRSERRKPAEPWPKVLERPEFAPLRASAAFGEAWARWIEHCRTGGSKAREPGGMRAVVMFREALDVGPERYAIALDRAIASNWMGPHVDAQERVVGRPRGEQPLSRSEAATDATERATREYLGRVAADPGMAAGLGFEGAEERSAEVVDVGDHEHERRTA